MRCKNCGAELKEGHKFCTRCGAAIAPEENPFDTSHMSEPEEDVSSYYPSGNSPKNSSNTVWWVAGVIIIAACIGLGFLLAKSTTPNQTIKITTADSESAVSREPDREKSEEEEEEPKAPEKSTVPVSEEETPQIDSPAPIEEYPQPARNNSAFVYILPDSSARALSRPEVAGLSSYELCLARNEIYARHGYIFNSSELKQYFGAQDWYVPSIPSSQFSDSYLSNVEKSNVALIQQEEKVKGEYKPH